MKARLYEKYVKEVAPALVEKRKYVNVHEVPRIQKIDVNIPLFRAFTLGFLKETTGLLSDEEIELLPMGALLLPYIMGLRFLTDYIDGDVYYKIHSPGHNLQRARAQFQLLRRLEAVYPALKEIVIDAAEKYK